MFFQASLKERFDWEGPAGAQWEVLEGGKPCTDCGVLVEGTALYFGGAGARQAVTADLDLRGAKSVLICFYQLQGGFLFIIIFGGGFIDRFVEYWARIGSEDNMTMCHRPTCRREGVLLDYSVDGGEAKSMLIHFRVSKFSLHALHVTAQACPGLSCMRWTI